VVVGVSAVAGGLESASSPLAAPLIDEAIAGAACSSVLSSFVFDFVVGIIVTCTNAIGTAGGRLSVERLELELQRLREAELQLRRGVFKCKLISGFPPPCLGQPIDRRRLQQMRLLIIFHVTVIAPAFSLVDVALLMQTSLDRELGYIIKIHTKRLLSFFWTTW
jgi:hypothetical protein